MKNIAKALSIVFHPLLIPSIGFLLLFVTNNAYSHQPQEVKVMLWVAIFVFTFLIPSFLILLLKLIGVIKSLEMEDHHERIYPMLISFLSYFACIFILHHFNAPLIMQLLLTGAIISVGMAGMVSIVWKISAHLTGYGGLLAAIMILALHLSSNFSLVISIAFMLGGIIAWARIYLKSHTVPQVFSGFILGFSSIFFLIYLSGVFR